MRLNASVGWLLSLQVFAVCIYTGRSYSDVPTIKLYDPRVESSSSPDVIEYVSGIEETIFLEESEGAEPDPQKMAPHRLECTCSFKKSNPQGRPDSAYHIAKLPTTEIDELSDRKLQDVIRSNSASGSKIPEVRNLKNYGN